MKKSLLVVPALGVMLLAAAGSVGGTVAWFSSVSSVEASLNNFQARAIDGNLAIDFTEGYGTEVTSANAVETGVKVLDDCVLTHASYDALTERLFTLTSENNMKIKEVTNTASWKARAAFDGTDDHDAYWAVSWSMTFTYDFGAETLVNLYFDPSSALRAAAAEGFDVVKGFRVAFVGETYDAGTEPGHTASTTTEHCLAVTRVWGKYQASTNYISGTSFDAEKDKDPAQMSDLHEGTAFAADNFIGSNAAAIPAEGQISNEMTGVTYLGQFNIADENKAQSKKATIKINCVAWFEGTDANVVDAANLNAVTASMRFAAREYRAPAQAPAQGD